MTTEVEVLDSNTLPDLSINYARLENTSVSVVSTLAQQIDKLKDKKMFDVELADAVIRIFDICGRHNVKLGSLMAEKIAFNIHRPDHKLENRLKENGKKF